MDVARQTRTKQTTLVLATTQVFTTKEYTNSYSLAATDACIVNALFVA